MFKRDACQEALSLLYSISNRKSADRDRNACSDLDVDMAELEVARAKIALEDAELEILRQCGEQK